MVGKAFRVLAILLLTFRSLVQIELSHNDMRLIFCAMFLKNDCEPSKNGRF